MIIITHNISNIYNDKDNNNNTQYSCESFWNPISNPVHTYA